MKRERARRQIKHPAIASASTQNPKNTAVSVSGHLIARTAPICPATLELDMAIEALFSVHPQWKEADLQPVVHDMVNHAPICADPSRAVYLDFTRLDSSDMVWGWTIASASASGTPETDRQVHAEAQLHIHAPADPAYTREFGRFERLASYAQCRALLSSDLVGRGDVDVLQGRNVYPAFNGVVDYGELYRGVQCVVGHADESAGRAAQAAPGRDVARRGAQRLLQPVGGMWVNLMTDCPSEDMYIATGCELSMRSPRAAVALDGRENGLDVWHVLARHSRQSDKIFMTDIFVFDASTGVLSEVTLGIQYARVAKASMSKMLARLTTDEASLRIKPPAPPVTKASVGFDRVEGRTKQPHLKTDKSKEKEEEHSGRPDITDDVRNLVANVSGVEPAEITLDSEMADLGIDSLMGMELAARLRPSSSASWAWPTSWRPQACASSSYASPMPCSVPDAYR